jgi:superfamily II DNA or RNA helicase
MERKNGFFQELRRYEKNLVASLGVSSKFSKLLFNKLKQYYPIIEEEQEERISFLHFVNRMSFWMATGSGKTIVLIKLIELLHELKSDGLIPDNDIMILTHRDDLVEQITELITEFNQESPRKIRIWDLRKFEDVKRGTMLSFKEDMNIFIYRSDLIAEETKEKQINFEDIENRGRWYLLLDEAHKGDKADSKRQLYYSILTRNGFLFNFSATFTDAWDILTTVYNFNLDTFIRQGYGKNVYLSQQELSAFRDKGDFNDRDKQSIILKALVLFTLSTNAKSNIDAATKAPSYHKPLLVSLVNSVHTEDADLEIFFKQLERIATEEIDFQLFDDVKRDLSKELSEHPTCTFGSDSVDLDNDGLMSLQLKDIRKSVFHTERKGSIEVKKIPGNDKELIFKLKTAELPFGLMRIGDCGKWVREKLTSYHIEETYDNESYFKHLDEESDNINILMGSRAFYEGWDSNRPNVMLFINIGRGDAKKYVVQSIGRGVRIEPIKNKRKRLSALRKENDSTAKNLCSQLRLPDISLIETLFVLGTNRKNVEQILESIKYESEASGEVIELKENPIRKEKSLLIPIYKDLGEVLPIEELPKFEGNRTLLKEFVSWVQDERVLYALYSDTNFVGPNTIQKTKDFIKAGDFVVDNSAEAFHQLYKLMSHVNIRLSDLDEFEELTDEIVHFRKIHVTLTEKECTRLKAIISRVSQYEDVSKREAELKKLLSEGKVNVDTFTEEVKKLGRLPQEEEFFSGGSILKIKNVLNHYFIPIIISDKEKIDYINHIINVESEKRFIEQLELYIGQKKNKLKEFDWWMFSKLDEHLDEIYIPYYNRDHNKIERFKPDFVFWLKKGKDYHILFVDPKGTKHTDYEFKVDGYRLIFEKDGAERVFSAKENAIRVHLFLYTEDRNKLAEGYKRFWFDDFERMIERIAP